MTGEVLRSKPDEEIHPSLGELEKELEEIRSKPETEFGEAGDFPLPATKKLNKIHALENAIKSHPDNPDKEAHEQAKKIANRSETVREALDKIDKKSDERKSSGKRLGE